MGEAAEGKNIAHGVKKVDLASLRQFRDRFDIPIPDEELEKVPYYVPAPDSEEVKYIQEKRAQLGGYVPQRRTKFSTPLTIPALNSFDSILEGSGDREISTTMAFVRVLNVLVKDKNIGKELFQSFLMKQEHLVWKGCSDNWEFTHLKVKNIFHKTETKWRIIKKIKRASTSRRYQ